VNWSNILHVAIALGVFAVLMALPSPWNAAVGASLLLWGREMRDHQRERQTAKQGHRNRFQVGDLLPGLFPLANHAPSGKYGPFKIDTFLDWAMPAAACFIAAGAWVIWHG
jgi:hypothetical protein